MTRRLIPLILLLLVSSACGGSHRTALLPTPGQRLHAAVKAAQAVYDPDSAGGTGYGTQASLLRKLGSGAWGTPQQWPDDLAFRPGVIYVTTANGGRLAELWTVEPSGRALSTLLGAPGKKVTYATQSPSLGMQMGMVVIRPGVLYPDMVRSALERVGFSRITVTGWNGGELRDGVHPIADGGNALTSTTGEVVGFTMFRTVADARKAIADGSLPAFTDKILLHTTWLEYRHASGAPDRSKAFRQAVAELRRELRTE